MYDVCIIGAGPAGATLARKLGGQRRVLLVDRRQLDRPSGDAPADRPCGGLLAPAAQQELARQGLGLPSSVVTGPQLFAVRAVDLDAGLERLYQRHYINVDRPAFDRWLVSQVPPRVDTAFGMRCVGVDRGAADSFVRLKTAAGGTAGVRARLVVAADGAASWVRRSVFAEHPEPARYVAVQAEFELADDDAAFGAYWSPAITDFYGWSVPKGGRLLIGAALPAGCSSTAFDAFLGRLAAHGVRFGRELHRSSAPVWRPRSPRHVAFGDERVMLLGEAAGLLSPSSAEGISYALRSGAAAADALESGVDGATARYRARARSMHANVSAKLVKSALVHAPGMRAAIMRTGMGAIPAGVPSLPQVADLLGI